MKKLSRYSAAALVLFALATTPALAWKVKVTKHPDGDYVASLIHDSEPARNETVGKYGSKSEARKAGKAAKKEKGFKAEEEGPCSDPTSGINC